jgi:tetratricopeptide (TPR) repeat protein
LRGGEAHVYRIAGPPGSFVRLGVEQRRIDVVVRLLAPDGRPIVAVDSPIGDRGEEPLPLILDRSGEARLEVLATEPGARGSYVARVEPPRPATGRDRALVAAERSFAAAEALRQQGDRMSLRAAVALDRELVQRFRALGERRREVDVLDRLGRLHTYLGEAGLAVETSREAVALARTLGDPQRTWSVLCILGVALRLRGEPEPALAAFQEALKTIAPLRDPAGEAQTHNHLGRAFADLGQVEPALASYERARALWRRVGRPEGEALANLGRLYATLGETDLALGALKEARARFAALGSERELAGVLVDLGVTYRDAGRLLAARMDLWRALRLYRRLGNGRGEAVALTEIGRLSEQAGRMDMARKAYEQALGYFRGRYRLDEAVALTNLGRLSAKAGRPGEAAAGFAEALPLFEATGSRLGAAAAWNGLARSRRALGDLHGALAAGGHALEEIESLRREPVSFDLRASFFASRQDPYDLHVAILMDLHRRNPAAGYALQALETVERVRARVFLDALAGAGRRSAEQEARPYGVAEIRRELAAPDALLLEYALGDEGSWLWAVSARETEAFPLPPRREIEARARAVHSLLADGDSTLGRGAAGEDLAELSRILLGPVADRLAERQETRRILLVPDGALNSLPFAALPLLAGRELASLPSASSLVALRRASAGRPAVPGTIAVLADPAFQDGFDGRFPRLIHSREEAQAILSLVPPSRALAALGPGASRKTAESGALARYRIVHFATHGVLDEEHPERSGILLSDGFLRSRDVLRLHLAADLVVLSACQTALGREVRGEGTVGLTRSFFYAGARRVLVSLWPVDDEATAELMSRFYTGLLRQKRTPAAALRDARLSLRRERGWESPYYWAGFVLEGDG